MSKSLAGIIFLSMVAGLFTIGSCTRDRDKPISTPSGAASAASRIAVIPGRIALLMGASGETKKPNFFIEDLRGFGRALAGRGWSVSYVAGSQDGELPSSVTATREHLLEGVRRTLESATFGQEVLLLFHSHGREQETYWGQRSHSIVNEDRNADGTEPGFDLDSIEPLLIAARTRGVRVGLVDLSCYSGSTQNLQGAACTISLAASRYVSLCSGREEERLFNSRFFQLPPAGTAADLEAQFLAARQFDHGSINLPRISSRPTPALAGWEDFLVKADPLDTFEDLKELRASPALFEPRVLLSELDRWIKALPKGAADAKLRAIRVEIESRLAKIYEIRKQLSAEMPALAKDQDTPTVDLEAPGRRSISIGVGFLAELLDAVQQTEAPDSFTDVQRNLLHAIEPVRASLDLLYAKPLTEHRARRSHFDELTESFAQAADLLFESERELYEAQPLPVTKENPCRDFVL